MAKGKERRGKAGGFTGKQDERPDNLKRKEWEPKGWNREATQEREFNGKKEKGKCGREAATR